MDIIFAPAGVRTTQTTVLYVEGRLMIVWRNIHSFIQLVSTFECDALLSEKLRLFNLVNYVY